MWNSKFYTVMIALTTVLLLAGVAFQVIEMNDYGIFAELGK